MGLQLLDVPDQTEEFGAALDAIRAEVLADRGPDDEAYIRRVVRAQAYLEIGGRATLCAAWFPPAWLAGTAMLAASKIVENMELGHNVMHGQWDWLDDPRIHSKSWEWDHPAPRALCAEHGLPYNSASLPRQAAGAWRRVLRMALP